MLPKKTLQERQQELQTLLSTPAGREELQQLASHYHAISNVLRPAGKSVITFLLVREREMGLIVD